MPNKIKIKKGDTVTVTAGREKGKTGTVARVVKETGRVMVDGVNLYKKFVRNQGTRRSGPSMQQVELPRAMDVSNVMIVCPSCKKPTRIGFVVEGETKTRVCKKCKATI
jgi:large subunit ribosomal protein L24